MSSHSSGFFSNAQRSALHLTRVKIMSPADDFYCKQNQKWYAWYMLSLGMPLWNSSKKHFHTCTDILFGSHRRGPHSLHQHHTQTRMCCLEWQGWDIISWMLSRMCHLCKCIVCSCISPSLSTPPLCDTPTPLLCNIQNGRNTVQDFSWEFNIPNVRNPITTCSLHNL